MTSKASESFEQDYIKNLVGQRRRARLVCYEFKDQGKDLEASEIIDFVFRAHEAGYKEFAFPLVTPLPGSGVRIRFFLEKRTQAT